MAVLDWARCPLLIASAAVFLLGVSWRPDSLWRMPAAAVPSARARLDFGTGAAIEAAFSRFVPSGGLHHSATLVNLNPYVFHTRFPFGRLMHAFLVWPARMQLATLFGRRGVRT